MAEAGVTPFLTGGRGASVASPLVLLPLHPPLFVLTEPWPAIILAWKTSVILVGNQEILNFNLSFASFSEPYPCSLLDTKALFEILNL